MRIINRKKYGLSVNQVLLANQKEDTLKCDIVRYTRCNISIPELKKRWGETVSYTLVTNISDSSEEIFGRFSKTYRYDIRRSSNDIINNTCYWSKDLKSSASDTIINEFHMTYNLFCDVSNQQSLKRVFNEKRINEYIDNDCFMLSVATFENGKVFHAYIYDDETAVLIYSASDYRNKDVDKNLAGRANKQLHFYDILQFKDKGLRIYDWGNISSKNNANPQGIDFFKSNFGGEYAEKYFYTQGKSFIGIIICKLLKYYHSFGRVLCGCLRNI